MVKTMLKSSRREIRQSLGRYLAILAIVGLGVGFFAGLRMSQPSMMATGIDYIDTHHLYDFRLLSTLGFTEEDVDYFAGLDGVAVARGSVYTEFLWEQSEGEEAVLLAHALTDEVNEPGLVAGRMPQSAHECLGDARYFTEEDLGRPVKVAGDNDEDTLELLAYDSYTLVGLVNSPYYLNFERGTSSIGSGSVAGFVYIPEAGFDFEAYYEIFLRLENWEEPYSDAYSDQIDSLKPELERLAEERGDLRYTTVYEDAMAEIRDGEQELADGWEEYYSERADVDQELADAYQELTDGEQEYADALSDYEQGRIDYADGLKKYADGLKEYADGEAEIADAEQKLADGWSEYEKAKADAERELAEAREKLTDGEAEYADALKKYEDGLAELTDGQRELANGQSRLNAARRQLDSAKEQLEGAEAGLSAAKKQLDEGEASYQQLNSLYQSVDQMAGQFGMGSAEEFIQETYEDPALAAMVDAALQAQGGLAALQGGWAQAEQELGAPLTQGALDGLHGQLDQGKAEYEAGLKTYRDGQADYESGLQQYQSGREQLSDAQKQVVEGEQELDEAKAQLSDARRELDEGWTEYNDGAAEAERELADAYEELMDGQRELEDAKQELQDAQQELADAQRELQDAKRELDKAPGELSDARQELDDGWQEYYDGVAEADEEFADAYGELMDGEQEVQDARQELEDLKGAATYVLTREENTGYVCFDNDTSIVAAISVVFPVFFFLVAALVCMTTMTRMVDEQRTQIGVLKAMGYSNGQIIGKYLFYSGSAALIGSVLGYALFCYGLPWVIWEIYDLMYGFADLAFVFDPLLAAVSFGVALLCSMGATYLSCRVELTKPAAELIRPKAPKAGRRVFLEHITPVWRRLSFLHKVSVRNVLRYRSRLVMMVLGIGGCTALLATGFGLRDSIKSVADVQYDEITLYDYSVTFQDPQSEEDVAGYLAEHGWEQQNSLLVHSGSTDVVAGGGTKSVYLVVSSTDSLDGFLSLHSGVEPVAYPGPGEVVVNIGLAQALGISRGDVIQLRDDTLGDMSVTVSAICDNYVFNYVYVSHQTYEQQLGQPPEYKTLYLLAHPEADPYGEGVLLADGDGISNVTVNQATRDRVNNMLSRMDYIVIVVVLCAAALAFIVLYNLTNINITERIREIATIKVLGFYQNEVASYVFREILMLSVLGSLAGLVMGKALHAFVMAQIQVDGMHFPSQILPGSYLAALALTMVFAVVITMGMQPRLRKVDMAESLKSIE